MKDMREKGMSITQIADELGRDRKTVRKWLQADEPIGYVRRKPAAGKLDAYKDYIRHRMAEGCLNASVILDEIREKGYTGSSTILRVFMQPLRPAVQSRATERFETKPGEQAQVDWGHFRVDHDGRMKRLYAFVMVLGFSRAMYLEFTEDERLDTLMGCHTRAFAYFGGMTQSCLYDNMKTVVTGQDEGGETIWNAQFARFAKHYGFTLRRCKPYRPRTKGKVENGVGYVRKNFWPRVRTFTGLQDLNVQARHWLDTVANKRLHGTTFRVPHELWKEESLTPVNDVAFAYAEHPKSMGRHQIVSNKKHFEGIRSTSSRPVGEPTPRYVSQIAPEVSERSLSVYDSLMEEAVFQ